MPMQDVKKTDMKSETNVKRVRRRNRWLPLYIAVVLVLTAGVGVALSTTVFFNVENIVVTGEAEQYTVTDIVKAADVCSGDNLIKLNTDEVAKRVYDNLIYIETVDVQKKFPDELVINVQKCLESYNIVYDNGILLASATGKIISNSMEAAEGLPIFYGYLPLCECQRRYGGFTLYSVWDFVSGRSCTFKSRCFCDTCMELRWQA